MNIEDTFQKKTVITDGAWGTQFQKLGLRPGRLSDIWNISNPGKVKLVAQNYVDAGSQIILTNTFRANRIALAETEYADQVEQINKSGAEISKEAAGDKALVFASIGPSGKLLMMQEVSEEELYEAFSEQSRALAAGGADGIVVETMSDLQEAKIAVKAAKEAGLPVVACMVYDSGKDKHYTMMGNSPEEAALELDQAGAVVIGANCGQGIEGFVSICKRLKSATNKKIWIKANAGIPEMIDGKIEYRISAEKFASFVPDLINAGATFIGGCCGTTPQFIQEMVKYKDS